MGYYWVMVNGIGFGTIRAGSADEAVKIASERPEFKAKYSTPDGLRAEILPYPAHPFLNPLEHDCPEFCRSPMICKGRSSCPQSYACSE